MKKKTGVTLLVLLSVFIAIQLYQPPRNVTEGPVGAMDIAQSYTLPADVRMILKTSCYDCHSNHSNYQWYNYIQPARMVVENHIKNAKEDLNFSEWGTYSNRKKERLLTAIKKQTETKKMPLPSYTLMHRNAKLDNKEIKILLSWLESQQ